MNYEKDYENAVHIKTAIIGLEKEEMPRFSWQEHPVNSMLTSLEVETFIRYLSPNIFHFIVVMDFQCGTRVIEDLSKLALRGKWSNISVEMATVFGLENEKRNWRNKRKYRKISKNVPERTFADQKQQHLYLLESCDEFLIMMNGKNDYKEELIQRATLMRKEVTIIDSEQAQEQLEKMGHYLILPEYNPKEKVTVPEEQNPTTFQKVNHVESSKNDDNDV